MLYQAETKSAGIIQIGDFSSSDDALSWAIARFADDLMWVEPMPTAPPITVNTTGSGLSLSSTSWLLIGLLLLALMGNKR